MDTPNLPAVQQPAMVGFEPQTWKEAAELAQALSKSAIIPRALIGKPNDVLVILMNGRELGLGPMQSLRQIFVVDGKPSLSADLMVGLVLRSGLCEYFSCVESGDQGATYETKRKGNLGPTRMSFTAADAKRAGLAGKDNWMKYPGPMYRSRAATALARAVYPDVIGNLYDPEELGASDVQKVDAPVPPTPKKRPSKNEVVLEPELVAEAIDSGPQLAPNVAPQPTKGGKVAPETADALEGIPAVVAAASDPHLKITDPVGKKAEPAAPAPAVLRSHRGLTREEWNAQDEEQKLERGDISRLMCKRILDLAKAQGLGDDPKVAMGQVMALLKEDFEKDFEAWDGKELWQCSKGIGQYAIDQLRGAS